MNVCTKYVCLFVCLLICMFDVFLFIFFLNKYIYITSKTSCVKVRGDFM